MGHGDDECGVDLCRKIKVGAKANSRDMRRADVVSSKKVGGILLSS